MTQEFQQMLQLTAMGATGQPIGMNGAAIEWEKLMGAAKRQKTECFVAYALKHSPALACPDEVSAPLQKQARAMMLFNAARKQAVVQLLEQMEAAGIHGVLLKGYAIADCYAVPECRISGDADIWIDPKDEERACEFMKAQGFTVEPRWKNGHHAVCQHPSIGCVELHVILYDEIVEDVWFGKMDGSEFVSQPHMLVEGEDGRYYTLGHTDHMIFLALHMIKHFIISGLTVQMLLDVALYFKKHKAEIDADRLWQTIDSLHYDQLLHCIFWAMVRYCGFKQEDFPGICKEAPELVEEILSDLEDGGWLGFADKGAREEGWYEYNRQKLLREQSKEHYWLYMIQWKWAQYMSALFPTRSYLEKRYPYLVRKPWLYPAAWLHRLLFRGSKAVKNGVLTTHMVVDEQKISTTGKARVQLFRKLDMIE